MNIPDVFLIAKDTFRANKLRTFLTISAVTIGIGAMLFLLSLGRGLQVATIERITTAESLRLLHVSKGPSDSTLLNNEMIQRFEKITGVEKVSPRRSFSVLITRDMTTTESVIHGIESDFQDLEIDQLTEGTVWKKGTDGIVVTKSLVKLLGVDNAKKALQEKISVEILVPVGTTGEYASVKKSYVISGVVDAEEENFLFADFHDFGKEADAVDFHTVKVLVQKPDQLTAVRKSVHDLGFTVDSPADTIREVNVVFNVAQGILILFGAIALVVASIGMFNTLTISLLERTHDIGIMKSLGATNRDILAIFMTEAMILGFVGGLCGIAAGWFSGWVINQFVAQLAEKFNGQTIQLFLVPWNAAWILLGIAIVAGLLTGLYPAWRASRLNPLVALRYE